jgi:hypothetical protein
MIRLQQNFSSLLNSQKKLKKIYEEEQINSKTVHLKKVSHCCAALSDNYSKNHQS